MTPHMRALSTGITLIATLFTANGRAQGGQDPHLAPLRTPPSLDTSIRIDDMVFSPEQLGQGPVPASGKQSYIYGLGLRLGAWDFGVIPYELAPGFSDAERQRVLAAMQTWMQVAPIVWVPATTQFGVLAITRDELSGPEASPCFAFVGQGGRGRPSRLNLGSACSNSSHTIAHEMGHVLSLGHEHQRPDRDGYVTIDLTNLPPSLHSSFARGTVSAYQMVGPYDYGSIMHYSAFSGAIDRSRPTIRPNDGSWLNQMGLAPEPSRGDHNSVELLYSQLLRESTLRVPTEAARQRFDRADMLLAMERLHSLYMSRMGLHRPQGLSIDGRPDFLGIAQWIFDIYLPARSGGFSSEGAFDIVVAAITRTDEWRSKNPGRTSLTPASFRPSVSLNRVEFLDVLNRLDRFYSAPEGLQRPNGLSISGGPDFLGIATWIFDIYLAERLNGISPNGAWTITENAIRNTGEWRSKH
jgi:hypothetical protein